MSDGAPIYHYINDGDRLGNLRGAGTYTGKVNDFTRELSTENQMIVSIDQQADLDRLVDQFIYVNNDGAETGAYRIFNAERMENGDVLLNLEDTTLIRSYKNANDIYGGYNYNIAPGQGFTRCV